MQCTLVHASDTLTWVCWPYHFHGLPLRMQPVPVGTPMQECCAGAAKGCLSCSCAVVPSPADMHDGRTGVSPRLTPLATPLATPLTCGMLQSMCCCIRDGCCTPPPLPACVLRLELPVAIAATRGSPLNA